MGTITETTFRFSNGIGQASYQKRAPLDPEATAKDKSYVMSDVTYVILHNTFFVPLQMIIYSQAYNEISFFQEFAQVRKRLAFTLAVAYGSVKILVES